MVKAIRNPSGELLDFEYLPGGDEFSDWVCILGHGVTGNRERPVIAETANALNAEGLATVAFSFAGNGESEGLFQEATITKEVDDLRAVIDAFAGKKVIYIGHSMGAAVGTIVASREGRICGLVSLAGMVDTKCFAETEFGEETPDQGSMWEEKECPLSQAFMDDLTTVIGTVKTQAEKVAVPWLLLHGSSDDVVLPRDSEWVKTVQPALAQHVVIDGADHSFSGVHRGQQIDVVKKWILDLIED